MLSIERQIYALEVMQNYTPEELEGAMALAAIAAACGVGDLKLDDDLFDEVASELQATFGSRYQDVVDLADLLCGFEFGETREEGDFDA